ncbi:hypothetical protein BGZ83_012184 [Gryganskiella cystojenkinii]|nr:hypothetical protein BGZ83_012184 [Gryganskiella cystojenkinii]
MDPLLGLLPREIFDAIVPFLSLHDYTVCIRVNKAWHQAFIDHVWHTVEITEFKENYGRFMDGHGCHYLSPSAPVHLSRIRVLTVQFSEILDLFYVGEEDKESEFECGYNDEVYGEKQSSLSPSPPLPIIPPNLPFLQELVVDFRENPILDRILGPSTTTTTIATGRFRGREPNEIPCELIDIRPILQLFERSAKTLKKFKINLYPLYYRHQFEATARILASLPANLETLTLEAFVHLLVMPARSLRHDDWLSEKAKTTNLVDHSYRRLLAMPTTGILRKLKNLYLKGIHMIDVEVLFELLLTSNSSRRNHGQREGAVVHESIKRDFKGERCPELEELIMDNTWCSMNDALTARIVAAGPLKGWKTLGFAEYSLAFGPLTHAAILNHSSQSLENLRVETNELSSARIQMYLCSCPRLKRFDLIPYHFDREVDWHMLLAQDIVKSDWVCLELESFKCMIGGIPRPDLQKRTNSRPLTGDLHDPERYSAQDSRVLQRKVLAQLGRLTKLRELTLGVDNVINSEDNGESAWATDKYIEGIEFHDQNHLQLGRQYESLTMSLDDGLDRLQNLKSLRRVHLERMNIRQGEREQVWMKEHWPEFGKETKDRFWTERGFCVRVGTDRCLRLGIDPDTDFGESYLETFDWW